MTSLTLTLAIEIRAPVQRCFDLARSMDFHQHSMQSTGERIISGRATGLINLNETVEFEGKHLGLTRRFTAKITSFNPPHQFTDEQIRGDFRSFTHTHTFEDISTSPDAQATRVTDHLDFDAGWNIFGKIIETALIRPHLQNLLSQHQQNLKRALETQEFLKYLA